MKDIKNILIIGLGSIGSRHFKIIKKLRPNIKISILRRKDSKKNNLENLADNIFYDIQDALKNEIDGAIICSPSVFHFNQAKKFIELKIPLFIEKPLSNNFKECLKLNNLAKKNKS